MKILSIADKESRSLWDFYTKDKLYGAELILSAGDLDPLYLSFLVTMASVPLLYVHGNHDDCYQTTPPEGCVCIDDLIYVHNGIRILGLGGSMRYKEGEHQYTEAKMKRRIRRLRSEIKKNKGFDILLTHSPAYNLNDGDDPPHRGFECFNDLINEYSPRYFIHGHWHQNYTSSFKRYDRLNDTCVINSYERCVFEYEAPPLPFVKK